MTSRIGIAAFTVFAFACSSAGSSDGVGSTEEALEGGSATVGPSRTILMNATGYNPRYDDLSNPWASAKPDFAAGLVESGAKMVRYPGGTFADNWDYDNNHTFVPKAHAKPKDNGWVDLDPIAPKIAEVVENSYKAGFYTYPIADLARVASGAGAADVVFQMNMVTPGADYYAEAWGRKIDVESDIPKEGIDCHAQPGHVWCKMLDDRYARFARMLKRANNAGIRVRFIELGNEYYFPIHYVEQTFKTGHAHGMAANYIADRLHAEFGDDLRVAATASMVEGGGERADSWDSGLHDALVRSKVHYVTLHAYHAIDVPKHYDDDTFASALQGWNEASERRLHRAKMFLSDGTSPSRIWYTETNANWDGGLDPGEGTAKDEMKWAQALTDAYSTVFYYDRGDAAMYLQFLFNSIVRKTPESGTLLYNRGLALEPFMRASRNATSIRVVDAPGVKNIPGTGRAYVNGLCFEADVTRCAIVNLLGHAVHLDLHGAIKADDVRTQGYAGSLDSIDIPTSVDRADKANHVTVPAYSVTMVAPAP